MNLNLPLVHLDASRAPHKAAYIMGASEGLWALIVALMTALERGMSQAELSAGNNNPYTVHVLLDIAEDSPIWRNMACLSHPPWRRRPASNKQRAQLDRYGLPHTPSTTAGKASVDLARHLAYPKPS